MQLSFNPRDRGFNWDDTLSLWTKVIPGGGKFSMEETRFRGSVHTEYTIKKILQNEQPVIFKGIIKTNRFAYDLFTSLGIENE